MSNKDQVPFFDDGDTAVQVAEPQLKGTYNVSGSVIE